MALASIVKSDSDKDSEKVENVGCSKGIKEESENRKIFIEHMNNYSTRVLRLRRSTEPSLRRLMNLA